MKKLVLISIFLMILTIGAVSASDNTTLDELTTIGNDASVIQSVEGDSNSEESAQIPEKLNASYEIIVDEDQLSKSAFESDFNIEMYEREFLNGNLEIYIDDELKFNCNPAVDYERDFDSWESFDYPNSYSILDIYFLDNLGLTYGMHKAEFKYSGDSLFNDFDEIRYFNYTYMKFYVPEDENEYESTCIIGAESNDATGNLKIVLDNKTIHDEEFTGYEYMYLENLTFGSHTYDIYYSGNSKFKPIHKHATFNRTYTFDAYFNDNDAEISLDEKIIKINLPEDAESTVSVVVNNKTYLARAENGYASTIITNFNLGQNIIYITYKDDKYSETTIIKNITVLPALHFTYADSKEYQSDANVELIMPENTQGILSIKVDGKNITSDLVNGIALIPLGDVKCGTHDFEITYSGDGEEYFQNRTYENISITNQTGDKKDWDLEFALYVDYPNGQCELHINKPGDIEIGGTETYYIDGQKCIEISRENDDYYYYDGPNKWEELIRILGEHYSSLNNGTHTLTVSFSGDEHYAPKSKSITFEKPLLKKIFSNAFLTVDKEYVTVELPEGEKGTLFITINNKTDVAYLSDQTYYLVPHDLKEGIWDINLTYKGINLSKTKIVKLDSLPHFELTCDDYYFKDSEKVAYIECGDDASLKRMNVLIDNKKYKESLYSGEIDFKNLAAGKHTLRIDYKNSQNKIIKTVKKTFTILTYSYPKFELKDSNSLELNDALSEYNPTITLSNDTTLIMDINLNGNINGKVSVYKTLAEIGGRYGDEIYDTVIEAYKTFNLKKGKAQITIPTNVLNKTYSLKLVIDLNDGNVINKSFKTYWSAKVVHPAKMTYGENKTLTVYLPGYDNRIIGMFGNFKPIYSKIINGKATFSLSTLPVRNGVPVTLIYSQEKYDKEIGYYNSILETYTLKLNIQDTSSDKINMYYNDGTVYSLKVAKIYGKEVSKGQTITFKIGKTTIKVKTDKNGVAKLKIPDKVTPGKYTLTAIYKNAKIAKKLTVKQVLSLKAVKVKKSAKKLVLTATLKAKKVLKNKKVTFKFNGKTYKTKTNSKGVAKVTVKKAVLKKLKAGKKITYSATYLKNTVKKTIKVQK